MHRLVVAAVVLSGCIVGEPPPSTPSQRATSALEARSGSTVTGTATFTRAGGVSTLAISITGAPMGLHGIHLHAVGDCSAADAASAGGHWNPMIGGNVQMLGELGNINVGPDGNGSIGSTDMRWTVGDGSETDVIGHAIVVHGNVDAGPRVACGVIE